MTGAGDERVRNAAADGQWQTLRRATPPQRRALVSGWAGFFVDMVDIYLPVIALAPAMAYFQPAELPDAQATTLFYVMFAATLLGRPVGAAVFGHLADRLGRRRVALWSIAGFSTCTVAIGLLPGYDTWGLAAAAVLVVLRLLDGVFLGGEYTAATPLAFEHCPAGARGLYGGLLMAAYAAAYATVSALVLALLLVLPAGAYESWGWRVPFLVGGCAGFVFLAYRSRVPESSLWRATLAREGTPAGRVRAPVRRVLGPGRGDFAQVLMLMIGLWFIATSVVSVLPALLLHHLDRPAPWVTGVLMVAQLGLALAFVEAGLMSQRWGRRKVLIAGAALSGTAGMGVYAVTVTVPMPATMLMILVVATEMIVLGVWGVATSYCNERFATAVRASGFGLAYSLALVPASFYAFYLAALENLLPGHVTQLVLLGVGSVLAVWGALLGPETRDVDLGRPDLRSHVAAPRTQSSSATGAAR